MSTFHTQQLPGRTVITDNGTEYLYFSGTDYLGMGHNADFQGFLQDGLGKYGTHYGSSRNNSLRLGVYEQAENELAAFAGAPASLIVSSGMWAGQLVMKLINGFAGSGATIHYAPRVHPALWGPHYINNQIPWNSWAQAIVKDIEESTPDTAHIICTDAIGSPWVEAFDLSIFAALPPSKKIWLLVDDSHSLGVLGEKGSGVFQKLHQKIPVNLLVVSSLNKALGIPSGVVFGEPAHLEVLRSSPWFAGASPPAPAYIYALHSLLLNHSFETAHTLLKENIDYFNKKIEGSDMFCCIPEYPVYCSEDVRLFDHLLRQDIMASCFSYPSPADPPVTRLAINALHQKKDLDRLAEICMNF